MCFNRKCSFDSGQNPPCVSVAVSRTFYAPKILRAYEQIVRGAVFTQ